MKKIFLILAILLSVAPVMVSADDGPGPSTCDRPYEYLDGKYKDLAPTCKGISNTNTVVSLDPALKEDYILGSHSSIILGYNNGIFNISRYSESIAISTTTKIIFSGNNNPEIIVSPQLKTVLLDKSFFIEKIHSIFNSNGINLIKGDVINYVYSIRIINEDELLKYLEDNNVKTTLEKFLSERSLSSKVGDSVIKNYDGSYTVSAFDYNDYGKHIHAPKGDIVESQYINVDKGQFLDDKDLQIDYVGGKHCDGACGSVVPLTSPLESVTNYWLYTKKDGKLVLAWQKSEYGLDNGKIKTVTNADKNVNIALLFSNSSDVASTTTSSGIASSSSTATTSVVSQTEKKVGFIARFFNFILSWFN